MTTVLIPNHCPPEMVLWEVSFFGKVKTLSVCNFSIITQAKAGMRNRKILIMIPVPRALVRIRIKKLSVAISA